MNKDAHIRSIGRSLAVLRVVNQAGAMSMSQISQAVGIPYPTTCRIVYTLQEEGVLEREVSRKFYRPTALVQSLAHGYQDHSGLVEFSRQQLERLTLQHFWPVSLTTRVGQYMVVRDCTHSLSPMALTNYQPGASFPLVECASGHVMLAFADHDKRTNWLDAIEACDKVPDPHIVEILRSDEYIDSIRADGYALRGYNQFTNTPGRTSSIAVPIFHHGEVCAALTLVFFAVSMDREKAVERYVADLRGAAAAIALQLAGPDGGKSSKRISKAYVESPNLGIA